MAAQRSSQPFQVGQFVMVLEWRDDGHGFDYRGRSGVVVNVGSADQNMPQVQYSDNTSNSYHNRYMLDSAVLLPAPAIPQPVPLDPTEGGAICFICQQVMWPCEEVSISWCQPVAHYVHRDCWNAQTKRFKFACQLCRQPEVGEMELIAVCALSGVEYDPHKPLEFEVASHLPLYGQELIRRFLNREDGYTTDDLYRMLAQQRRAGAPDNEDEPDDEL